VLGLAEAEITEKLKRRGKFHWLKRGIVGDARRTLEKEVPAGVEIFSEFSRQYPQGKLAATLIGRVGRDGGGQNGLEAFLNSSLSAGKFSHSVARDARGRLVNHLGVSKISITDDVHPRLEGIGAQLTIDSFIQRIVEAELKAGVDSAKAQSGVAVLMDAENGEILSMAEHRKGVEKMKGMNRFRSIVVQDNFEPGSTIKPLVAAAALDRGLISENEIMDCGTGRVRFGSYSIGDVHPIGKVPLEQVLVQSSNVCMAKIANKLGAKGLHSFLTSIGFGSKTGLPLSGEAKGILRNYKNWRPVSVATHGFGQGMAVTALQLTRAYSSLINGGYLVNPQLLVDNSDASAGKTRVLSEKTANSILQMLTGVTEDKHGTGRAAKIEGLTVYGKTGTAQQPRRDGRGYDPNRVLASFVGAIDGKDIGLNRKLVMFVAIDEPGVSPRWGGRLAGPVFKKSMEKVLSYLLSSSGSALRASMKSHNDNKIS
jgi:cell division protein FtsI (penicillin-binding protein 3)